MFFRHLSLTFAFTLAVALFTFTIPRALGVELLFPSTFLRIPHRRVALPRHLLLLLDLTLASFDFLALALETTCTALGVAFVKTIRLRCSRRRCRCIARTARRGRLLQRTLRIHACAAVSCNLFHDDLLFSAEILLPDVDIRGR